MRFTLLVINGSHILCTPVGEVNTTKLFEIINFEAII